MVHISSPTEGDSSESPGPDSALRRSNLAGLEKPVLRRHNHTTSSKFNLLRRQAELQVALQPEPFSAPVYRALPIRTDSSPFVTIPPGTRIIHKN